MVSTQNEVTKIELKSKAVTFEKKNKKLKLMQEIFCET